MGGTRGIFFPSLHLPLHFWNFSHFDIQKNMTYLSGGMAVVLQGSFSQSYNMTQRNVFNITRAATPGFYILRHHFSRLNNLWVVFFLMFF